MARIRTWVILARISQIILSLASASVSLVLAAYSWYYTPWLVAVTASVSFGITILAAFGIFAACIHPPNEFYAPLYRLVLMQDCVALAFVVTAITCLSVTYTTGYYVSEVLVAPIACNVLCLVPVIFLIARTARLRKTGMLSPTVVYQTESPSKPQPYQEWTHPRDMVALEQRLSTIEERLYNTRTSKDYRHMEHYNRNPSSRPLSVAETELSGPRTLTHRSMLSSAPTLAPSHPAPMYSMQVDK